VATDTIKRWRKSYMSESKNKWAQEYRDKVFEMENLNKKEIRGLYRIFIKVCQ
jgi:thiaminase